MGSDSVSSLKISVSDSQGMGKGRKCWILIDHIKKKQWQEISSQNPSQNFHILSLISQPYKPTATETSPATPGGRLEACWANAPGFCSHSLPSTQIFGAKN